MHPAASRACRAVVVALALWTGFAIRAATAVEIVPVTSAKGITAWMVRDASVPAISLSFAFRAGSADDPVGKEGLAEMTASLMDEGAGDLDSQAFQRRLEDIAASLRFSAARDYFRGALRTLSANRDEAFRLLALSLAKPRFDAEPVERIRAQLLSVLDDETEDPRVVAGHALFEAMFPAHPYGRPPRGTIATVKALTADDLRRFQRSYLARDNLLVGVVGDITPDELARRLDELFGDLPAKSAPRALTPAKPAAAGRTIVVQRDIPQSIVLMAEPGIARTDPDWYAAYIVNRILGGGGFASRLTEEVREKRGLAYSVYSYLNPLEQAPLIVGGVATANARVAESLGLIRAEWRRMAQGGPTEEEMQSAKTYINGSFPLQFDSSRNIADMLVEIQASKLGIDYIGRRPKLIDAVTLDQAKRVARRLFDAGRLTVVVVGKPEGVSSTPPGTP